MSEHDGRVPERIWANGLGCYGTTDGGVAEYVRADLHVSAIAERDEARRRRDEWRKKAEGYDAVRKALREKVGAPWPPNLSRAMWAGIAADEKRRADDAEAERDAASAEAERLREAVGILSGAVLDAATACARWAEQSETGGWSTHQVEANRRLATDLTVRAGRARAAISDGEG